MMTSTRPVVAGADTHSQTHHVAVLDATTGQLLGDRQFPATTAGYRAILAFAATQGQLLRFGVEGTIVGDGRQWDQARFNAFPSKAAFMAVALDPARLEAQRSHREVALADTYTMILRPTIDRLAERRQA